MHPGSLAEGPIVWGLPQRVLVPGAIGFVTSWGAVMCFPPSLLVTRASCRRTRHVNAQIPGAGDWAFPWLLQLPR